MKRDLWLAYLLALAAFFGPAGLHRFYLGKPMTGILYLLTWGLFGFGTLYDLVRMPALVREQNALLLPPSRRPLFLRAVSPEEDRAAEAMLREYRLAGLLPPARPEVERSPERMILRLAKEHGGNVTVALTVLETNLSTRRAKKELERLRKAGFCDLDVAEDGAELYRFKGLGSTTPLVQ